MNNFDCVLFDLDGTLTDSFDGITNSVLYALDKLSVTKPGKSELRFFVGPPLGESFAKLLNCDAAAAEHAVSLYREYYSVYGWKENRVYDGVPQMLDALAAAGKTLYVATSKPEKFSKAIISHFGLDKYFKFVAGATFDSSRSQKHQVIDYALKTCGINRSRAIMVGDRMHDVDGAKRNGMKSVGVLYGYGSREELSDAGADYIAQTPEEVVDIIKNADLLSFE